MRIIFSEFFLFYTCLFLRQLEIRMEFSLEAWSDTEDMSLDSSSDEGQRKHEGKDTDGDWEMLDPRYDVPETPSTTSDEPPPRPSFTKDSDADTDEEDDGPGELVPRTKPGGYDSRVEQMLYENPELPILITEAGKSAESGGRYIVYTIRTGV